MTINTKRFLIEPSEFVNDEDAIGGDPHYLACMKIYSKLENHFENA